MPRAPILSRELFYYRLPDGSFVLADWCLVNTSLGAMIEPRPMMTPTAGAAIVLQDVSFDKISEIDASAAYSVLGTWGNQVPVDYRRD